MSKAMYIFDMPKCCNDCCILGVNGQYPMCNATGEIIGYNFVNKMRMSKCPLRDVPEKVDMEYGYKTTDYCSDYDDGWNACIDEILENT